MEISLCMIVRDEEDVIERCITSVKNIVDEIIIVDTGSIDNTVNIVKKMGAKVYNFQWEDDFAKARNYSFSKATKDYILWLDADDVIEYTDIKGFEKLKEYLDDKNDIDSVLMKYIIEVNDENKPIFIIPRNRLVKREKNFQWQGEVHEYLDVNGNILDTDICIFHKKEKSITNRNLKIYEKLIANNKNFSPRDIYHYATELDVNGKYDEAIEQYLKYLNTHDKCLNLKRRTLNRLINLYSDKNDMENEIKYILKLDECDIPRADFCCKLGHYYLTKQEINKAIHWYSLAINNHCDELEKSLDNPYSNTYIPWIHLCICYTLKNDYKLAYTCNEEARKYKPNDPYVIYNKKLLKNNIDKL